MTMIGLMGSSAGPDPYMAIGALGGTLVAYGYIWHAVGTLRLSNDKHLYFAQRNYTSNGLFGVNVQDVFSDLGEWATAGGTASNYEARAKIVSSEGGSLGGPFDTWLSLGTTRDWTLTNTVPDGSTARAEVLLDIRNSSTQRIVGSTTFVMTAQRYS